MVRVVGMVVVLPPTILLDGLRFLEHHACGQTVLVLGDSEMSINFMLQKYIPSLQELVLRVQEAQDILRRWRTTGGPKVTFRHVDCTHNMWADWLACVEANVWRRFSQ